MWMIVPLVYTVERICDDVYLSPMRPSPLIRHCEYCASMSDWDPSLSSFLRKRPSLYRLNTRHWSYADIKFSTRALFSNPTACKHVRYTGWTEDSTHHRVNLLPLFPVEADEDPQYKVITFIRHRLVAHPAVSDMPLLPNSRIEVRRLENG